MAGSNDENPNPKAHRLLEVFDRFRRAEWHKSMVEGFNTSELKVLFYIRRGNEQDPRGVPVSVISSMMEVASPTVTPLVKSLERQGLVIRQHDLDDRRIVRIQITDKGEEISRQATLSFSRRFARLHDYLGEERSAQLADLLEEVYLYLERESGRGKDIEQTGIGDEEK